MTRLERASHIAQIIAATAIVISVIYLSVQVRDGNRVTLAAVRHELTADLVNAAEIWTANADMADLWERGTAGESLTPAEQLRLNSAAYIDLRVWENVHYQYRLGLLSADEFASFRLNLRFLMQHRIYHVFWETEREIFTDHFRALVDELILEIERDGPIATGAHSAGHPVDDPDRVEDSP